MRVGIPKGLLYCKYHPFYETFFSFLGAELLTSENTNKLIVDKGVHVCVDEACLPIKVYHGHVASIKDQCDYLVIPRIMRICADEYICPKFCGLPEMILYSIPSLPPVTTEPLYMHTESALYQWCVSVGSVLTHSRKAIKQAFFMAQKAQRSHQTGLNETGKTLHVMLAGHPYILYDDYLNMSVVKKLRAKGIGIITEEFAGDRIRKLQVNRLEKKPFWTFQRKLFGAAAALQQQKKIDGIIYLSSFACGIDSVIIDLIRYAVGDFPLLVLKLDEHTGEAGVDTRLEAFSDMLERRRLHEDNHPAYGQCLFGGENPV